MGFRTDIASISAHVDAKDLIAYGDCPVCGAGNPRKPLGEVVNAPQVTLSMCENCRAVSASHFPTEAYLSKYYEGDFRHIFALYNQEKEQADIALSDPERFASRLDKVLRIREFGSRDVFRIIDFGGGDGTIARLLAEKTPQNLRVEIVVIDYGLNLCQSSRDNISIEKLDSLDEISQSADLVIASASLEHVPSVKPVLDKLLSITAVNGYFYGRTPYVLPLKRIIPWLDTGFPAHLHDMGIEFWNRVPQTFNVSEFKIVVSRPSGVQVAFRVNPLLNMVAHTLKFPAIAERALLPGRNKLFWPFVGGWEIFLRKEASSVGDEKSRRN